MLLISEPGRGKTANINVPAKFIKEIEILNNTIQHKLFGRTLTSHIGLASKLLDWGTSIVNFTEKMMHQTRRRLTWNLWLGKSRVDDLRGCSTVLAPRPTNHQKNNETGLAMENGVFSSRNMV